MSAKKWTPLHLELLIWYRTRCEDYENAQAPAVIEYTGDLESQGLLYRSPSNRLIVTPRGQAFLRLLCCTPVPKQAWVDAEGRLIPED